MGFRTQAQVDRLRPPDGKADGYVWDDECTGLSIRLQGTAKRWVVWYQAGGKRRRVTLGAVAGTPLKEARIQAGRVVGGARDGKDILSERASVKARQADTLGKLVDIYLERRAKPRHRKRTYVEVERYLRKRWATLHDRPLDAITRRDVASRLEEIRTGHGPIAANRARTYLGSAFTWAMRQGLTDSNPVLGTEPPAAEKEGDRVLEPGELQLIWRCTGDAGEFGTIVRLLMITIQRREEVAGMVWPELELDRGLWTIPPARTKNKLEHVVPLPRQALALLPKRREARAYMFGRGRKGGFSGFSRSKERLVAAIAAHRAREAGHDPTQVDLEAWRLPRWTLHDLRRTGDTMMHELGIEPHVVEAVVNHRSGFRVGVAGTYNRARYLEPKRVALQSWANWLESVVEGREPASNVIALTTAG